MRLVIQCKAHSTTKTNECQEALLDAARFLEDELKNIQADFLIEVLDAEQDKKIFHSNHAHPTDECAA